MNKEVLKNMMEKLNFPDESQNELLMLFDSLMPNSDFVNIIKQYNSCSLSFIQSLDQIKLLSQNQNLCVYSVYMLFLLCLAPQLREQYLQKGFTVQLFYETMSDLRYKLEECRLVHGVCGTFVPQWYKGFFEMRIFALGRLQFEINNTWFDCTVNNKHIPKGTRVLSVHIPRTGERLSRELVIDSYNKAKEFFKDEFLDEVIFICNSWLLYPWNRSVLKDGSNLAMFYDDFTIVESGEYKDYSETWRLFDCLYNEKVDALPNDSSLRCAYIERIKAKQPTGYGTGVILMKI